MKKLFGIGLLAVALAGCTTAQVQTSVTLICTTEGVAYNYYMIAIAPSKTEAQVRKVQNAHTAMQLLCEAGASYAQIAAANEKAIAERSK